MTARNQRITLLSLSAVVGLTRFLPLSRGPWDWDEILFCIAVGDFNVAAHQPHPAGFPLFILLGKIARFFAGSDFHALQAVNVIASLFVFPVMYATARAFRLDFAGSIAAGLIFSFLTNVWFYGGTAFSDTLGMVTFLAAIAAYLNGRHYVSASVLLAAGVLVRPQNALVAVFPWTIATVRLLRERRHRPVIAGSLVLIGLVAIGYGISAVDSGVSAYVNSLRGHSHYVTLADSVANEARPPMTDVVLTYLDPFDAGKVSWLLNILALIGLVAGRRHVAAEVLLTFVPFIVFSMLAANPAGSSRFSLNYLAGIVILAVEGLRNAGVSPAERAASRRRPPNQDGSETLPAQPAGRRRALVLALVLAIVLGRLIAWGLPAFDTPRTTLAPPTAAALWVRDRVPITSTIFVHGSMQPWVRYLAPRHPRVVVNDPSEVLSHPSVANGWYIAAAAPPAAAGAIGFVRPRNRTWNVVTKRGFEAFVQPTRELIDFGEGWYDLEGTWRWSSRRALLRFGPNGEPRELRMQFHVPVHAHRKPVHVTFSVNGAPIGTVVAQADNEVRYLIRGRADRLNEIAIELSDTIVPGGGDTRELGLMLQSWSWRQP